MEPFIGEIRLFPLHYPPKGWLICNGNLLEIRSHTTLFSIIGVNYGGDGTINFALPNIQGRAVLGAGTGLGLSTYSVGDDAGMESVMLTRSNLPPHNHMVTTYASNTDGALDGLPAETNFLGRYKVRGNPSVAEHFLPGSENLDTELSPITVGLAGGNEQHSNMQPYLTLLYCIATEGIYPMKP
ncbi:phage tail protein [Ancylobacter sp. FA202]|uniref:phage tail protein n=1 Tax=Ancylobacter sp. FA202 TaxID=1111106 RepID=UPI00036C9AAD|nr:tail fiber protein [Ancylobacter sp. FA202]